MLASNTETLLEKCQRTNKATKMGPAILYMIQFNILPSNSGQLIAEQSIFLFASFFPNSTSFVTEVYASTVPAINCNLHFQTTLSIIRWPQVPVVVLCLGASTVAC